MILVTGAGGKTGKALIHALESAGESARAFIYSSRDEEMITAAGASEVIIGDMLNLDEFIKAAIGVRAIYHICPNVHPDEVEIGVNAIQASLSNHVEQFVYHSVIHPQIEAMPHHWLKLRVEELIIASGLPFTILQPTAYIQNILGQMKSISSHETYEVPYSVETRISLVDLGDVVAAATIVLKDRQHIGATYELCGPDFPNQTEVASMLSKNLGRHIKAIQIPRKQWRMNAIGKGWGGYQIDTLIKMFKYYEENNLKGSPYILENLLGRAPNTFSSLLTLHI